MSLSRCGFLLIAVLGFVTPSHGAVRGGLTTGPISFTGQSVINFDYATSDIYNNLLNGLSYSTGTNSPTLFFTNGYPKGTLSSNVISNPNPVNGTGIGSSGYYGHYVFAWTGVSEFNFQIGPTIIYSGGAQVFPLSTSGSSFSNSGAIAGLSSIFTNNIGTGSNLNAEFAFGTLITSVGTNGGLVEFTTVSGAVGSIPNNTQFTVQINNIVSGLPASGPNSDGSWTATATGSSTFTIAASGSYAGSVVVQVSGGPGTQSEAIYIPGNGNISIDVGSPAISHNFSNAYLCKKTNLTACQAGQIVTQAVINDIGVNGLNAGYVRYMDIICTQCIYANFSEHTPKASLSYNVGQWLTGKWGNTSTGAADEFDVSNPSDSPASGAYVEGETVQFMANRSNTTHNPTIKLGTRVAVPIFDGAINEVPLVLYSSTGTSTHANSSIVGNGTTATVTASSAHGLTVGKVYGISISGSATPGFDGNYACTVTTTTALTCPSGTSGTAATPGTYQVQTAPGDIVSLTFNASYFGGGTHTTNYPVNTTVTNITGSVGAGTNVLTVTAVSSGTITAGQMPNVGGSYPAGAPNGIVLPYGTNGTTGTGGTGTYALSVGQSSSQSVTQLSGPFGPDTTLGAVVGNISFTLNTDATLTKQGISCQYNPPVICYYWPAQGALNVTSSTSGTGAEAFAPGTLDINTPGSTSESIIIGNSYTLIYNPILGGFINLGAGGMFEGFPLEAIAEISSRAKVGALLPMPIDYTQASWQLLGSWSATNMNGVPIATEVGNEIWNLNENPAHRVNSKGSMLGFSYFNSFFGTYLELGLLVSQNLTAFKTGYSSAGGNLSNVQSVLEGWALDGLTNGGSGAMVPFRWQGVNLTPTTTFTGTFGTTNGINTVTISGLPGTVVPGWTMTGSCVTGTARIANSLGAPFNNAGNGTYVIDSAQSGTCTVTATNPNYATATGPGFTANANSYNAFPNRPIDTVDAVGWADYVSGALINGEVQTVTGTQSCYNALFTASQNYAQGIATGNAALVTSALNAWNTDYVSGSNCGAFVAATTINGFMGAGGYTTAGTAVEPAYEALIAVYDGARSSGKANLNIIQYEGGQNESFASNGTAGTTPFNAATLNSQFVSNGWTSLDATYGYPSFGAGSSVTATNMTNLLIAYAQSPQFYHSQLCLWQQSKVIHSTRKFYPAQFGITGPGNVLTPGAALWGLYTGSDINTTKQQNWFAERDFSNGVTATCP